MCGIAGIYRFDRPTDEPDLSLVRGMTEALRHRGPDAWGVSRLGNAVFGHRRLSIIDLSPAGNQPLSDTLGEVWITYNGEIYNYPELRQELIDLGHGFRSTSDTEILVVGYREWGMRKLLERLRGMFAFALLDRSQPQPRFVLARDRVGIKPLYYFSTGEYLLFASEICGLLASGLFSPSIDRSSFLSFLQWGTIPEPQTGIEGVRSLEPGQYLSSESTRGECQQYWQVENFLEPLEGPPAGSMDHSEELRPLLEKVVGIHQLSDVPVGVFLSGGIDSSSLALLAASGRDDPIQTISVIFDEATFDEARWAKLVAEKCRSRHTEVRVSGHDFVSQMSEVFKAFDQPTIDGVNTYYVAWAARRRGLKVVLSGLGGDELFLGYRHFHNASRGERACKMLGVVPSWLRRPGLDIIGWLSALAGRKSADRLRYLNQPGPASYYQLYRGLFHDSEIQQLSAATREEMQALNAEVQAVQSPTFLGNVVASEFKGYLRNQLLRDADVMSMAHSVEVRVPFLDHILVEKVLGWPASTQLSPGVNKPLLVGAMGETLPREVWDRPKQGFVFPLQNWLNQQSRRLLMETLESDWLERSAVQKIWTGFRQGRTHWARPWATLVWSHWQRSLN